MTGSQPQRRGGRRGRRRWLAASVIVVLLAAGGVAAWWLLRPVPDDPAIAATVLATSWSQGDLASAPFMDAPPDLEDRYTSLVEALAADPPRVEVVAVADPAADSDPLTTTAELVVTWQLPHGRTWDYATQAKLRRAEGELTWSVVWEPGLVHPRLEEGMALGQRRLAAPRGDILAADGTPLVTDREVVDIGIQPGRVDDLEVLVTDLAEAMTALGIELDTARLSDRVAAADDDAFVDVLTLREDDYLQIRDDVQPLPGTVFRRRQAPLAPTRSFARFTLGSAGPVTAEMLEEQPARYARGDVAGRSGLQEAYDERLFGTPGIEIRLVGDDVPDDAVLFLTDPVAGQPITVTLDERIQRAADTAIEDTGSPTGLAVVRPSDGHILALASSSDAGFDLARTAQIAPGSTFKVVTTQALLAETGLTARTPIDCPSEITVEGRTISNAESQQLGTVPFRAAFVNSCNTAFVQLAQDLPQTALQDAGARFGIALDWGLGRLGGFSGQVPTTGDAVDLAATAIGQGRTLVSPLAMAGVAATVANGGFPGLALVLEPQPAGAGDDVAPLPQGHAGLLQDLMRGVVTEGTGTAVAEAPGGPVHGKTGTAEFNAGDGTLRTHAWFIGYQDDLAFAVAVTDTPGGYGGELAAPVVERLLRLLAASP